MKLLVSNIKWIMVVSGLLTCTMIYAAVAPEAALADNFGESLSGPVAEVVVRNWGVLITLIGAMLVYAATRPELRPFVLVVAGASKLAFIGLVLWQGERFLSQQVRIAVGIDAVWVVLFAAYLAATRGKVQA